MNTLVTEAIARLVGKSTQAIFHLKQAMGGGKTHLLVGLGLLAKHAGLRKSLIPGVPGATTRSLLVELAGFLRRKLITLRPGEAQAAEILEQLLLAQRLG